MAHCGFVVRPMFPADRSPLQEFFHHCRLQATWLPDAARFDADFAAESVGETVFVAVAGQGEILGLVSVSIADSFIHHLYVKTQAQRQGIGRALLAELEGLMPLPWRLKCPPQNEIALKFYKALGWWQAATGTSNWGDYLLLEFSGRQTRATK